MTLDAAMRETVREENRAILEMLAEIKAMLNPPKEWLTAQEMAEQMGCSVSTIRRRARAGEIEARGSGSLRRYRR